MTRDRLALISDVHGNVTALEAVLADLDERGITRVLNLGDYVGKGPRGREVVELCRERCEVNLLVGDGPVPDTVGYADTHDPFYESQLASRTLFNTGSAGNATGDPTASYVVLEGLLDEPEPAPFSIAFVRVPYDVEAELAVAREMGVPQYAGYEAELRMGLYRGALADFEDGELDLDHYYHAVPGTAAREVPA